MLPARCNRKKEKRLRVCDACQCRCDKLRVGLLQGDMVKVSDAYSSGLVVLDCPYTIFPDHLYPTHCAVVGGNMALLSWLVRDKRSSISARDANGMTPFAKACAMGHVEMMFWFVRTNGVDTQEVHDMQVLRQGLQSLLISSKVLLTPSAVHMVASEAPRPRTPPATMGDPQTEPPTYRTRAEDSDSDPETDRLTVGGDDLENECTICFEKEINSVLVPCGHCCTCEACGKVLKDNGKDCPVCRAKIDQVVKTFQTGNT